MMVLERKSPNKPPKLEKFHFVFDVPQCDPAPTPIMRQFLANFTPDSSAANTPVTSPSTDPEDPLSSSGFFALSPDGMKTAKKKAFVEACSLGRFDVARKLLREPSGNITINVDDVVDNDTGNTTLHRACDRWEIDQIKFLIEAGAKVDAQNFNGETALARACINLSNYKIVHLLVKKGNADVDLLTRLGDVDNALSRAMASRQWTRDHETEYDNSLQTFFHVRIVRLLVKAGATLKRDPLNVSDYFGAEVMPTFMSRYYGLSPFFLDANEKFRRFALTPLELESIVRPLIIKLIIAARHQSSFNVARFRSQLKECTFHRQYPQLDIDEFARDIEAQFPLKLQDMARFAVSSRLPPSYQSRCDAINNKLNLPDKMKDFVKFRDLKDYIDLLEQKAIYNVAPPSPVSPTVTTSNISIIVTNSDS